MSTRQDTVLIPALQDTLPQASQPVSFGLADESPTEVEVDDLSELFEHDADADFCARMAAKDAVTAAMVKVHGELVPALLSLGFEPAAVRRALYNVFSKALAAA